MAKFKLIKTYEYYLARSFRQFCGSVAQFLRHTACVLCNSLTDNVLRKCLFCRLKQALSMFKTGTFGM